LITSPFNVGGEKTGTEGEEESIEEPSKVSTSTGDGIATKVAFVFDVEMVSVDIMGIEIKIL